MDGSDLSLAEKYAESGYVAPIRALETEVALELRERLEQHEREHGRLSKAHRNNPHLLFTWADKLIRSPGILGPIKEVLGGNLLVWGSTLFIKEPHDPGFVSWHQDSTYWGLEPADVVTAWIALGDSHEDNGALQIVPGSHKLEQLAHRDTFGEGNMLSRGQEIAVDVDPADAVTLELEPGEMSLHHVRMVHGSQPNRSNRRRVGLAIRYLPTHVRQVGGGEDSATLVSGSDRFGNFAPERRPGKDFGDEERVFHELIERRQQAIIMEDARLA